MGRVPFTGHYATMPMHNTANFYSCKNDKFQIKKKKFHILAQNIDCGYPLESQSNFRANLGKNVFPCKLRFYCMKVGFKGVYITQTYYIYHILSCKLYCLQQTESHCEKSAASCKHFCDFNNPLHHTFI